MPFSIRHRRKNQVPRIDGAEMVARQCGDFWTTFGPASIDLVKINSCKFRGLAGQRGIACRWQGALWLAAALGSQFLWMGLAGLTMNGPAPIAVEIAADLGLVLTCATGCFF